MTLGVPGTGRAFFPAVNSAPKTRLPPWPSPLTWTSDAALTEFGTDLRPSLGRGHADKASDIDVARVAGVGTKILLRCRN